MRYMSSDCSHDSQAEQLSQGEAAAHPALGKDESLARDGGEGDPTAHPHQAAETKTERAPGRTRELPCAQHLEQELRHRS